jgi:hypothetical protein
MALRTCSIDRYATDLERTSTIGPRQRAKKKLVRRTGQNSLHNLTQKVAAQKAILIVPLFITSAPATGYGLTVACQPINFFDLLRKDQDSLTNCVKEITINQTCGE